MDENASQQSNKKSLTRENLQLFDESTTKLDRTASTWELTEFRQPLQVQSHLEMPGILVQLGHIQCT